jgi:hypothetical protein
MIQFQRLFNKFINEGLNRFLRDAKFYIRQEITQLPQDIYYFHCNNTHNVLDEDWDNLIILDSARFDFFEKYRILPGELSKKQSSGTWSRPYLRRNFGGRDLLDTVYIGENPYIHQVDISGFFAVHAVDVSEISVARTGSHPLDNNQKIRELISKYPNKKIIVHLMQPHTPHYTSTGKRYDTSIDVTGSSHAENDERLRIRYINSMVFGMLRAAIINMNLIGKTVITADHGENLGELINGKKIYAHKNFTLECKSVPWLELPTKQRKQILRGDVQQNIELSDSVSMQLKALGYK